MNSKTATQTTISTPDPMPVRQFFTGTLHHLLFLAFMVRAALAAFQHACTWVHWYCVEAPDIDFLYKKSDSHD